MADQTLYWLVNGWFCLENGRWPTVILHTVRVIWIMVLYQTIWFLQIKLKPPLPPSKPDSIPGIVCSRFWCPNLQSLSLGCLLLILRLPQIANTRYELMLPHHHFTNYCTLCTHTHNAWYAHSLNPQQQSKVHPQNRSTLLLTTTHAPIYLITCRTCNKQYVEQMGQT